MKLWISGSILSARKITVPTAARVAATAPAHPAADRAINDEIRAASECRDRFTGRQKETLFGGGRQALVGAS
jgi:hypothetical protein